MSQSSTLTPAQKAAILQNLQYQHQHQQQHQQQQQQMRLNQSGRHAGGSLDHSLLTSMQQQAKQNTMLLNMVRQGEVNKDF